MLGSLAPIVRGRCRACGACRNIHVLKELPSPRCNCASCEGELEVVFTGTKGALPIEFSARGCRCSDRREPVLELESVAGPEPEPAPIEPEPRRGPQPRASLQARIDAWLTEVGIGHGGAEETTRRFDPREFVMFARVERLHRVSCDSIYRKYIDAKILAPLSLLELDIVIDEICDEIGDRIDELVCPITLEVMSDPVVAADGRTYERAAITDWLSSHDTSPLTNLPLEHKDLRTNDALLAMLSKFHAWDPLSAAAPGDGLKAAMPLEHAVLEKARALLSNIEAVQAELARVLPEDHGAASLAARWAGTLQRMVEPFVVGVFGESLAGKTTLVRALDAERQRQGGHFSDHQYLSRRLTFVEWTSASGQRVGGTEHLCDVSVCVVDASQGVVGDDDQVGESLLAGLPAELTELTGRERQQLLLNLRKARAEQAASATDKLWGEENSIAGENPRGLSHALVDAGCHGVRVLVAVNKMDTVDASAADSVCTQLESTLYQIFNEDDDIGRIEAIGVGNDEAPLPYSTPSTLAADLAPQDVHFISARAVDQQQQEEEEEEKAAGKDGFNRLCEQIRVCLDDAIQARAEALKRLVSELHEPLFGIKHKLLFWGRFKSPDTSSPLSAAAKADTTRVGKADRLVGTLYNEAIVGNSVTKGAIQLAEEAREACGGDTERAVTYIAKWDVGGAFARGAVTGVGGFTTMLVAVPASVAASWLLGMRLAFAIAHLGGYDVFEPATCNLAFAAMTGESAIAAVELSSDEVATASEGLTTTKSDVNRQQVAQTVGQEQLHRALSAAASRGLSEAAATDLAEQAAKRATQASLQRLTQQELAEAAGTKLLTAGTGRSLAKAIPLIGAAISGAVELYFAEQVAKRAKATFVPGDTDVQGECSWCLQVVTHTRTKACTVSRDVFQCGACNNRTLRCIAASCSRMARGGVLWDNGLCARCDPSSYANRAEAAELAQARVSLKTS